ncbi:putative cytochrome P450 [Xylaria cf. heliscus]|nr:putative cytochrome P450 [Xylaria cf. heliscus]
MEALSRDTQASILPFGYATVIATAFGVYLLFTWIYNVYFHALAGFPGPKIAAASGLYEFYHDVVRGGQYLYKIEEMHRKYGPIIRINPSEIVINDPSFYNEVYVTANTRRTNIWPRYRVGLGFDGSHLMTEDHDLHRRRRKPLEPFFSRLGITRVEETIISEAKDLNARLKQLKGSKSIICLDHVFSAFVGDVIGKVCCENPPLMMAKDEFGKQWHALIERIITKSLVFAHMPQLVYLARLVPTSLLYRLDPGAAGFNEYREVSLQAASRTRLRQSDSRQHPLDRKFDEKPTLFRHIVTGDMPPSERSVERLSREAMILFGGATGTTPHTLSLISYYVLSNPKIEERLKDDLAPLMLDFPNNLPRWTDLEKLPYLQAIVKEGLRLSYGLMRRLPRCSPDVALQYKQWTIPKDTPVGMGAYSLHTNFEVYPEPFKMNESWVPFSRGSRKCLGYNLAIAEINWALAVLFRPNGPELSLYETDESDIAPARDFLLPLPRASSRGCKVRVG